MINKEILKRYLAPFGYVKLGSNAYAVTDANGTKICEFISEIDGLSKEEFEGIQLIVRALNEFFIRREKE